MKVMNSEPEQSRGLRPLIVDNYTVFYVIKGEKVNITRVLYNASDISRRLAEE